MSKLSAIGLGIAAAYAAAGLAGPEDFPRRSRARRGTRVPERTAGAGEAAAPPGLAWGYDFFACAGAAAAV